MNSAQPKTMIAVENIVKRYGDFEAVKGITFNVEDGEIFGLLGPNGAGKSTLIRMMTTLIPPTSGKAIIAGHNVSKEADAVRRAIGVIPQALTSDIDLTVEENMSIYAKLYEVPKAKREKSIDELLEAVDLTKWRHAQTKTLSGGMRRRLEIARGLIHSPRILFLDEPTTGLDPVSRTNVWQMIRALREKSELTILITTHYMDEADKLCDRIAIVDHGILAALDSPARLKDSISGTDTVEAEFEKAPADWIAQLQTLAHVTSVTDRDGMVHIASNDGPATIAALMDLTRSRGVVVRRVSVQSTTLDDVFVHYTGNDLRDAAKEGARYDIGHLYR
jgi:ABC-2 type transport system ATP-binding protein